MSEIEIKREEGAHCFAVTQRNAQLLVASNDKAVQEVLSRILSLLGYEVTAAENGLEAATHFFTVAYDLVLTDLQMPLMNGWELSRLVKERSPTTPVIVVTGFCDDAHWEKMAMNTVDAIVTKPFKVKEIDKTIQNLLSGAA